MVEKFLLDIGMRCGTVKNFNTTIIEDLRKGEDAHWYFLTPIKANENVGGFKTATVSMAFPFFAVREDVTEADVINRLSVLLPEYEPTLLANLRQMLIVPDCTIFPIPFWANESGDSRNERKNFAQTSIHILSAKVTIKYRDSWFNCKC
jgi:hypothetical protein